MRKMLRWSAWAIVIAAAGWSALWFAGRSEVAEAFDRELERLAAGGLKVDYASRDLGGFPFAYVAELQDIVFRDTSSGVTGRIPSITGGADISAPSEITAALPPAFTVSLPIDPAARATDPRLPEALDLEVQSVGLEVSVSGTPGEAQRLSAIAEQVMLIHAAPENWLSFAVEFRGLDGEASRPAPGAPGRITSALSADAMDALVTLIDPAGQRLTLEAAGNGLTLTGATDQRDLALLSALLAGGEGQGTLALNGGPARLRLASQGADDAPDGELSFESRILSGVLSLADGVLEARLGADGGVVEMLPAEEGGMIAGAVRATMIEGLYRAPLGVSEQMRPIGLELAITGITPDETVWSALDAEEVLPRDPGVIDIAIDGTARFTRDLADRRPGEALPLELGNLEIRTAHVAALGATGEADGAVEFIQPIAQPKGRVTVRLDGALALLRRLHEAGLIDQQQLQGAAILLGTYTRAGEGRDDLVAEVTMDIDGIRINGEPLR